MFHLIKEEGAGKEGRKRGRTKEAGEEKKAGEKRGSVQSGGHTVKHLYISFGWDKRPPQATWELREGRSGPLWEEVRRMPKENTASERGRRVPSHPAACLQLGTDYLARPPGTASKQPPGLQWAPSAIPCRNPTPPVSATGCPDGHPKPVLLTALIVPQHRMPQDKEGPLKDRSPGQARNSSLPHSEEPYGPLVFIGLLCVAEKVRKEAGKQL